jgi:hypothetical protein
MPTEFWSQNYKGRDHFEDLHVDGEEVGRCGLDSSGSQQGSVTASCKHVNEPSDSINGEH